MELAEPPVVPSRIHRTYSNTTRLSETVNPQSYEFLTEYCGTTRSTLQRYCRILQNKRLRDPVPCGTHRISRNNLRNFAKLAEPPVVPRRIHRTKQNEPDLAEPTESRSTSHVVSCRTYRTLRYPQPSHSTLQNS